MTGFELLAHTDGFRTAAYADAAIVGRLILTAGACPLDAEGTIVGAGDVVAQAHSVMTNLEATLAAAGVGLDAVARTTIYVASSDRADLVAVWEVVRERFGSHEPPSTLLGVAVLGYPDQLVEVEAMAVRPESGH